MKLNLRILGELLANHQIDGNNDFQKLRLDHLYGKKYLVLKFYLK